ncbi:MAG: PIG-L family deacetylase [Phycisphaerae bacterium]|nr:PIG-L family deacetylase [Phycisphaerae bacterium]
MNKTVLGLFAHPDDAEFLCAGTLALLRQAGWAVHIATLSPGDKGTVEHTRDQISRIRKHEATQAAAVIDAQYHCLECEDIYILYDRHTINKAAALVRQVRPALVFTCSPEDYMVDHEMASRIAQTACFVCGIKNMEVDEPHFEPVPYLFYCDPVEGKDIQGRAIQATTLVDISGVMAIKEQMLCCHESQRNWLRVHHGMDEYVLAMKSFSAQRGALIDRAAAEGFRQHLGHSFPQDNILADILADHVHCNQE